MMAAMAAKAVEKVPWDHIQTVLLDLDGTLLDLSFDNGFWLDFIPSVYAAARSLTLEQARAVLASRFRACEGTLPWYCIDHWTRELGLDIEGLKRTQAGRIGWLPGAMSFLEQCRARGKRLVLLTNSHPTVLQIKDEQTGVLRYVDAAFSSHTFGAPKESAIFWKAIRGVEPFDPERTLFVDDTPTVLMAARTAGIRWLCGIRYPCLPTSVPARDHQDVLAVDTISDLAPELP
jgi:putative hydrolase of the HAD superfamily